MDVRVPIRVIIEELGGSIIWSAEEKKILIQLNDKKIELQINKSAAIVNGNDAVLQEPARIINSRTMIPLRFVVENLGYNVKWEGETRKVIISY